MTVRVSIYDDYEIVVAGIATMLSPYADRIEIVELNSNTVPMAPVDVTLYDGFAQGQADHHDLDELLVLDHVGHVVMYTWSFDPYLVRVTRERGLAGYLAKSIPAHQLADAIERVAAGEFVVSDPPPAPGRRTSPGDWPGRSLGLTERESEVLALITQGADTATMATTLYLSPNSIKSHVKSLYRKIGVHTRSEAMLWGLDHGFRPDRRRERID
jgi:DNA-binding NarL/FixJ family response regulator